MSNYRKVPVNKFNGRCPASAIKIGEVQKDNNNNVEFDHLSTWMNYGLQSTCMHAKFFFSTYLFYFILFYEK